MGFRGDEGARHQTLENKYMHVIYNDNRTRCNDADIELELLMLKKQKRSLVRIYLSFTYYYKCDKCNTTPQSVSAFGVKCKVGVA